MEHVTRLILIVYLTFSRIYKYERFLVILVPFELSKLRYVHYWKIEICRVPKSLSCALSRAHGKETIYRASQRKTTANKNHSANALLCHMPTRSTRQTPPLPCANRKGTRQLTGTRQIFSLPCVRTKNTRQSPNARQRCPFAVCCQIKHTAKKPCLPCA